MPETEMLRTALRFLTPFALYSYYRRKQTEQLQFRQPDWCTATTDTICCVERAVQFNSCTLRLLTEEVSMKISKVPAQFNFRVDCFWKEKFSGRLSAYIVTYSRGNYFQMLLFLAASWPSWQICKIAIFNLCDTRSVRTVKARVRE